MNSHFFKFLAIGVSALTVTLVLSFSIMAWTEPSSTPPNVNVGAPLNTSVNDQTKTGRLNIGTGLEYWITKIGDSFALVNAAGQTNFIVGQTDGNVGIGTTNPAGRFDVEGERICLNGECCASWQDCFLGASGGWVNGACEAGGCGVKQRQQYVACTTPGCKPIFTRCVEDQTCGQSVVCTSSSGCANCLGYARIDTCSFSNANVNVCAIGPSGSSCNYIAESFENTDCNIMKGWACNIYTPSDPLLLDFYMDEVSNPGGYLGEIKADGATGAPSVVANYCGGTSAHEFTFNMPQKTIGANWPVNDGLPHRIFVIGKQNTGTIATYGSYIYIFPTVVSLRCSPQ